MEDETLPSTCSSERIKRLLKRFLAHQVAQQALFKEIENEANSLIKSNEVLKATANENAILVTQKQKRCKEYKQEIGKLKEQLSLIASTRHPENPNPESDHGGSKAGAKEDVSSDEQPDRVERKSNKLSTNRQKKKVRYEEVSPGEKKSPILSSQLSGVEKNQDSERPSSLPAEEERVCSTQPQKIRSHPSARESEDHKDVFVPETVPLDLSSDSDDNDEEENGQDVNINRSIKNGRSSKLLRSRSKQNRNAIVQNFVIPETVPMDSIPPSPQDISIGDPGDNTKFLEHLIPLEQSTPMFPPPSGDSLQRKTLVAINSASPVYSNGKSTGNKKCMIPPTESQLSIDFSMTQMSPTFNGSKSTPHRQDTVVQKSSLSSVSCPRKSSISHQAYSAKESSATDKMISRTNPLNPAFNTPENTKQFRRSDVVTPDYNESGQSEASFLILQPHPSSRVPSQVRSEETSKEAAHPDHQQKSLAVPEGEQRKKRRLSEGPLEEAATKKSRTVKQEDISFDANINDENELYDGRKKKCPSRIETAGESVRAPPNAPEVLEKSENERKDYRLGNMSSKSGQSSVKNSSKSLKQTTLTKDSFKSVMTEDGQRVRDVNGGARVYVDSQDDPYMQKAIEQSMEVQGGAGGNDGFKVPTLPREREWKSDRSSSGVVRRRHHDNETIVEHNEDGDVSLVEGAFNDDGDLNGSLDPAVRFSFIGNEDDEDGDVTEDPETLTNKARMAEERKRFLNDSRSDEKRGRSGLQLIGHQTTPEAFGLRNMQLPEDMVRSRHQLFAEDSLDDMFADDDDDDDDGDDVDNHGDDDQGEYDEGDLHDYDRQGEGIEIQDGYGLGEDNVPETFATRRMKSEEATDPQRDNYQGRLGESDDVQSSFVREFDRPPHINEAPAYKYKEVVRKRDERQKLKGFSCKECYEYYSAAGLSNEEITKRAKICSKHRGHHSPPSTPEHYWSIGFPDTQTCIERGYVNEAVEEDVPKRKRKMRYNIPNFGKNKRQEQDN